MRFASVFDPRIWRLELNPTLSEVSTEQPLEGSKPQCPLQLFACMLQHLHCSCVLFFRARFSCGDVGFWICYSQPCFALGHE